MRCLSVVAVLLVMPAMTLRVDDTPRGKIVYTRKEGGCYLLHVMNADGTGDHMVPGQTAAANLFPTWSPDGNRIAFMAGADPKGRGFRICILGADGSDPITIDSPNTMDWRPCWSPDGKQIAFASGNEGMPRIYTAESRGGGIRAVTAAALGGMSPFWKRDGTAIGYTRLTEDGGKSALVFTRTDGSSTEIIAQDELHLRAGADALSPDGKRLLYIAIDYMNQTARLRKWEFASRTEENIGDAFAIDLTEGYHAYPTAAWSPDGRWILLSMPAEKGWGVFRLAPDGKANIRLTPEGIDCREGAWHA
jgi:Tol biopolymer transport system component